MMFFYNARYGFALESPVEIPGSIIAASCVSAIDLRKRKFSRFPHFSRRLLDPQLYMAGLDPAIQREAVERLASYPWFHGLDVPKYDSGEYRNPTQWKKEHGDNLVSKWKRKIPDAPSAVSKSARAAVEMQLIIGCSSILLPGPLTTIADQTLETELAWIDAGLQACSEFGTDKPVYATVALSEAVLHNVDPFKNQLIRTISDQIAHRRELAGAYILFEQADVNSYVWTSRDPLLCLMLLVDDLCRGAKKDAIVNYFGSFGAVASAAGASIWSSGFFQSQRRLSLRATSGRTRPRYYSLSLAGDVGVENDLKRLQDMGFGPKVFSPTTADERLRHALAKGQTPAVVPEWQYRIGNRTASQDHYIEIVARLGAKLEGLNRDGRVAEVKNWLEKANALASQLVEKGFGAGGQTEVVHQRLWLDVFNTWQQYVKQ
jgi:hypothetical protein